MTDETRRRAVTIGTTTLVPIGVAVAVGLAAISAIRRIDSQFSTINQQLLSIQKDLDGFWTRHEMAVHVFKLQQANPTLRVPDVNGGGGAN